MPITKYRSVEDLQPLLPREPGDPKNLEVALELSALCYGLRPWHFEPGLHKYRSVAEASAQQEAWARERKA